MKDKIIYQLSIVDIQTVAQDVFGRKLKASEITNELIASIAERIDWYDAIEGAIVDVLQVEQKED